MLACASTLGQLDGKGMHDLAEVPGIPPILPFAVDRGIDVGVASLPMYG